MVNKKNAFWIIFILVVVVVSLLLIFLPKEGSSTALGNSMLGGGGSVNTSKDTPTNATQNTVSTQTNVVTAGTTSKTVSNTSTQSTNVVRTTSKTNTYNTEGIVTEPYENDYQKYGDCGYIPPGYHRYQSNLCDPTQDELPITMPDPNEGLEPLNADPLWLSIQHGSLPCGKSNKLNYCQ